MELFKGTRESSFSRKEAQIKGEISSEYDLEVISYMLIGISIFIGLRYVIFDGEEDLDPIMDDIVRVLEEGMFTNEKGI